MNLHMKNLPDASTPAQFLTNQENRWASKSEAGSKNASEKLMKAGISYYNVNVSYDVTVSNGTTLGDAQKWANSNPAKRGIIADMTTITSTISNLMGAFGVNTAFITANADAAKKIGVDPKVEGYATNESYWPGFKDYDLILLNPKSSNLSVNDKITHEFGHNAAASNVVNTGNYEYTQPGLQSNDSGSIYPTAENTKAIINDPSNRKNIKN